MAKQTTPEPKPESGNVSKPVRPEIRKPKDKRFMYVIGLFLFFFAILFPITSSAKVAMLVIAADDKKFSGRADGNVYMRNGRIRKMAFFGKVLNAFTSAAKAVFANYNSQWRNLTQLQMKTWLNYETFVSDRFANQVKVTGKTAYVQLNVNIANSGGTEIDVAPPKSATPPTYIALTSLAADASAGTVNIAYVINAGAPTAFIYATKPLSAGVFKPSASAFRLVSIGDFTAASPLLFGTDYVARFGAITNETGSKIFVRVVNVDNATGLTSIANEISTVIVA